MSNEFRDLLRKVGSGSHTSQDLTRSEAETAMRLMLQQEATPAQIGAFFIAHRIKRPTSEELAGMLDACDHLAETLQPASFEHPVTVFGCPYDGHSRYIPLTPLTSLILSAAGMPVVMHGGTRMPTKEGIPLIEIWQGLGVFWDRLEIEQTQQVFEKTRLGFVYLPKHFPLADQLVPYRSQIGKRPPIATMELIWCPYAGNAHLVAGYVHPPTEERFQKTLHLRGVTSYTTIKGLEGSCDIPRERTAIIGVSQPNPNENEPALLERLLLHSRDYGFEGSDVPFESTPKLIEQMQSVLQGQPSELMKSAIWNGGFYLWRCGICADLKSGLMQAESILKSGKAAKKLEELALLSKGMNLELSC